MSDERPIGVMDSGMGGISVLKSLVSSMPGERFIFWGDNKNAPYGTRSAGEISILTGDIVEKLLARDIKALVIACNTATSVCAEDLRARLSMPVLGLEPALKPAEEYAGEGLVAVLATEVTLALDKYKLLLSRYGRNVVNIPCPELVEFVESGDTGSDDVVKCVADKLAPYPDVKAVVLGCTHFVWLKAAVRMAVPGAEVFDGNAGLARHMRKLLSERGLLSGAAEGGCEMHTTSDDPAIIARMNALMRA